MQGLTLLWRKRNEGMDFGAHNLTLAWLEARSPRCHRAFIFLNSSTRGPFYPMYMPQGWQWTEAFTSRLSNTVKVCRRAAAASADMTAAGLATCALLIRLWATKLLHDQLSSLALNQTLRPAGGGIVAGLLARRKPI